MSNQTHSGVQTNAANGGPKPASTAPHWVHVADSGAR